MEKKLTNRQKQALDTKKRIKKAAIELFNERGFDDVYIEDIAAAAGCSVGNIYHYYKNKEELAMHMTEHVDAEYAELAKLYRGDFSDVDPEVKKKYESMTAEEKLLDFVGQSLRISSGEAVLYASFMYGIKNPESGMLKVTWDRVYFSLLKELTEDCISEGTLPKDTDVSDMVDRLVTIHRGTLINWRLCGEEFDLVTMGVQMATDMLKGMKSGIISS